MASTALRNWPLTRAREASIPLAAAAGSATGAAPLPPTVKFGRYPLSPVPATGTRPVPGPDGTVRAWGAAVAWAGAGLFSRLAMRLAAVVAPGCAPLPPIVKFGPVGTVCMAVDAEGAGAGKAGRPGAVDRNALATIGPGSNLRSSGHARAGGTLDQATIGKGRHANRLGADPRTQRAHAADGRGLGVGLYWRTSRLNWGGGGSGRVGSSRGWGRRILAHQTRARIAPFCRSRGHDAAGLGVGVGQVVALLPVQLGRSSGSARQRGEYLGRIAGCWLLRRHACQCRICSKDGRCRLLCGVVVGAHLAAVGAGLCAILESGFAAGLVCGIDHGKQPRSAYRLHGVSRHDDFTGAEHGRHLVISRAAGAGHLAAVLHGLRVDHAAMPEVREARQALGCGLLGVVGGSAFLLGARKTCESRSC